MIRKLKIPNVKEIFVITYIIITTTQAFSTEKPVQLVTVHVGTNPFYGYFAAASVFKVAVEDIRRLYPISLGNLTHIALYLPGHDMCSDGADHVAEFFMEQYYQRKDLFDCQSAYSILANSGTVKLIV